MIRVRVALIVLGVLPIGYGGWLLAHTQRPAQLGQALIWAVGGVVLHDALLAPIAVALGWFGERVLPRPAARAASIALVLAGTVTVVAIPVLDGYAAGGANHTLLDRDYADGWLLVVGLVLVAAMMGAVASALAQRFDLPHRLGGRMAHGSRPRRR